jgi:hypothetical protein
VSQIPSFIDLLIGFFILFLLIHPPFALLIECRDASIEINQNASNVE